MDLTAVVFPRLWAAAGWIAAGALLVLAMRAAPWKRFGESEPVHVWYGTIFALVVLWNVQATVGEGFTFHLLGVAAFALLAGPALALVGGGVAVVLLIAVRGGLWESAGLAYVAMVAVPVATTWLVHRAAERRLPPNFFVYVFVAAFFGAALSLVAAGLAGAVALTAGAGRPGGPRVRRVRAVPHVPRIRRSDDHRDGPHAGRGLPSALGRDLRRCQVSRRAVAWGSRGRRHAGGPPFDPTQSTAEKSRCRAGGTAMESRGRVQSCATRQHGALLRRAVDHSIREP